jgi:hypothetical protein
VDRVVRPGTKRSDDATFLSILLSTFVMGFQMQIFFNIETVKSFSSFCLISKARVHIHLRKPHAPHTNARNCPAIESEGVMAFDQLDGIHKRLRTRFYWSS